MRCGISGLRWMLQQKKYYAQTFYGARCVKNPTSIDFFRRFSRSVSTIISNFNACPRAPCSASDIERQLNISKMTLTDKRNRLEDRKLEQLMQMRTSPAFVAKLKEIIKFFTALYCSHKICVPFFSKSKQFVSCQEYDKKI